MAGRRLLLCLVAAGIAAQAASAAEPSWRRADNARALRIGLTAKDAGPGWHEVGSKRSPSTVDLGSIMSSAPATACLGQDTPTKAEADLIITGGSISTLGRSLDTLTSFVMLFKTSTLAREQMPNPAAVGGVKSCVASELKADLGGTPRGRGRQRHPPAPADRLAALAGLPDRGATAGGPPLRRPRHAVGRPRHRRDALSLARRPARRFARAPRDRHLGAAARPLRRLTAPPGPLLPWETRGFDGSLATGSTNA